MYGRQGVCTPDLMGDPASAFSLRVWYTAMLRSAVLEVAGFCSQNPNNKHDAWLFNYTDYI